MANQVEVRELRITAKANIAVYRDADGNLWLDPETTHNPLFNLGNESGQGVKGDTGVAGADGAAGAAGAQGVKGDTGASGADGAAGVAGAQGVKGDTGASGADGAAGVAGAQGVKGDTGVAGAPGVNAYIPNVGSLSINAPRSGVVAGLEIQTINKEVTFIGRVLRFTGTLETTSTATGTASVQVNVGGLVLTFATLNLAATVQHFNFEVVVHVVSSTVAFAVVRQSIAAHGTNANTSQSDNATQIGIYASNSASIVFKSPITTTVKTKYSVIEIM